MSTFHPPIASIVTPRFNEWDTPLQKRLYRYMRPLDVGVNTYILDDGSVTTDYAIILDNGEYSNVTVPYPWFPNETPTVGPPEGAEGGPYGPPQPFATVTDWDLNVYTFSSENQGLRYVKYWFAGGHGAYAGISANLVTLLTAAHMTNYLS